MPLHRGFFKIIKQTKMLKQINVDNKEINFFVVSMETGKIKSSGDFNEDSWEDTYIDLNTMTVGVEPKICFNKAQRTRYSNREPVWTRLNYKITSIQKVKSDKSV